MNRKRRARELRRRLFAALAVIIGALLITVVALAVRRTEPEQERVAADTKAQSEASLPDTEVEVPDGQGEAAPDAGEETEAANGPEEKKQEEGAPEEAAESEATQTMDEPLPARSVTISAAGDCTLGTDAYFSYEGSFVAKYDEVQDPSYFFRGVRDLFSGDDLTIVNMEGTLTESTAREDKTFAFKAPAEYAEILAEGSVEAANLANNHSRDYGEQSYLDTIAAVEAVGIPTFGYDRHVVLDVNGVKVGLTGTYELADGIGCKDSLLEQIAAVKEEGAELIICSFHWGYERQNYPTETQVELAHTAIDHGADLVLGHHPHVLQGIERYHGRNIVYSLANFCFGGNFNPGDKDTMIFQQTFTIENGEVADDDVSEIIPCRVSSETWINDYQPTLLEGEEAERVRGRVEQYSSGLTTDPDVPAGGGSAET